MSTSTRTYNIDFQQQNKDGIVNATDLIAYLQSVMKIRNSKVFAQKELEFVDNSSSIDVVCTTNGVMKKNMKQYIRRFLKNKSLRNYIRVVGDGTDKITMEYLNPVEDEE